MLIIFGIMGLIVISVSVWIKKERKQDMFFVIGGLFLLVYSIGIGNLIFTILQGVFITSAFIEFLKKKR